MLVLASTGITVVDRFRVSMSTPSVTKIDGLLSVNGPGETDVSRVTKYDKGENMQ